MPHEAPVTLSLFVTVHPDGTDYPHLHVTGPLFRTPAQERRLGAIHRGLASLFAEGDEPAPGKTGEARPRIKHEPDPAQEIADAAEKMIKEAGFEDEYHPRAGVVVTRADMIERLRSLIERALSRDLLVHEVDSSRLDEETNAALFSAGLSLKKRLAAQEALAASAGEMSR